MSDDCCNKTMKYLLIVINTVFFIAGLCLAGFAGYAAFNPKSPIHNVEVLMRNTGVLHGLYIMLAVGLLLALLSLLGCFGACLDNRTLLGIYFVLLLILSILELVAIILCFVRYKTVKQTLVDSLKTGGKSKDEHIRLAHAVMTTILPEVQTRYHCCGLKGPNDYGSHIPHSCFAPIQIHPVSHDKKHDMDDDDTPVEGNSELGSAPVERDLVGGKNALTNTGNANTLSHTRSLGSLATTTTTQSTTTLSSFKTEATSKLPTATTAVPAIATTLSSFKTGATSKLPTATTAVPAIATTSVGVTTVPTAAVVTTEQSVQTSAGSQSTRETQSATSVATNKTTTGSAGHVFLHGGLYRKGCLSMLKPQIYAVGGLAIAILLLDVLALVLAGCLISTIKIGYNPIA